jgi:peptidoglycan hydrolase-like protein with peptidoglycan-binding domain
MNSSSTHQRNILGGITVLLALLIPSATFATYDAFAESQMSDVLKGSIDSLSDESASGIPIPILFGVELHDLNDTWGDARSAGRTHEGIDIFAPRGAYIVSPTEAVVVSVGYGSIGGNYVFTANPGGDRYYYAHLNSIAPGIVRGKALRMGDLIGYVGNTGNASFANPHLHFGIYTPSTINPYPLLTRAFTMDERLVYLARMIDASDDRESIARRVVDLHANFLNQAVNAGRTLPSVIQSTLDGTALPAREVYEPETTLYMGASDGTPVAVNASSPTAPAASTVSMPYYDLELGDEGEGVVWLQKHLIAAASGPAASRLSQFGATGYFGSVTKDALVEYQRKATISPAVGYYGPVTRNFIASGKVITLDEAMAKASTPVQIYPVKDTNLYIADGSSVRGNYTNVVSIKEDGTTVVTDSRTTTPAATVSNTNADYARDLELGDDGEDVKRLQKFLIDFDAGPEAAYLAGYGATGYFGRVTQGALKEYQEVVGISPSIGYFGPLTRKSVEGGESQSGELASTNATAQSIYPVKKTNLYIADGYSVRDQYENVVSVPTE